MPPQQLCSHPDHHLLTMVLPGPMASAVTPLPLQLHRTPPGSQFLTCPSLQPSFLGQTGLTKIPPVSSCKYASLCILLQKLLPKNPLSPKGKNCSPPITGFPKVPTGQPNVQRQATLCVAPIILIRSPTNTYRSIAAAPGVLWCLRSDQASAAKPLPINSISSAPHAPGLVCTESYLCFCKAQS